jgi:thiosulfate reductase cytochrome b subunit
MSSGLAEAPVAGIAPARPLIHPGWVRVTHWINALAVFLMITSGWRIYDASPLFGFAFPPALTIGDGLDGLQGALLWHFAAMWLLVANGLVYVTLGLAGGRFHRKLFPLHVGDVFRDFGAAVTGRLSHKDLSAYNAVQKLLYLGVLAAGLLAVVSGLSIWKSVQFQELTAFFGGYDTARYVHFAAMTAIVCFLAVHVTLAIIVPRSLRAMIIGR